MSHETEHRNDTRETVGQPSVEEVSQLYNPDRKPEKKASRSKQMAIIGGIAAGVIGIGLGAGAALGGGKEKAPEKTQPTAEAPVTPGVEVTPDTTETQVPDPANTEVAIPSPEDLIDPEAVPTTWVEWGTYDYLSPEAQAKVDSLNSMSVGDFRALPEEEQLAFNMFVIDNAQPVFDWILEQNDIDLHFTENPTTAQEITDNTAYTAMLASHLIFSDDDGNFLYDALLGKKLIGTYIHEQDMLNKWDSEMDTLDINNIWSYTLQAEQVMSTITESKTSDDGNTITYSYITNDGVTHKDAVAKKHEYTSLTTGEVTATYS